MRRAHDHEPPGHHWEWDGAGWQAAGPAPSNSVVDRHNYHVTFDEQRGCAVLTSGRSTFERGSAFVRVGPGYVGGGALPMTFTGTLGIGSTFSVAFGTGISTAQTLLVLGAGACPPPLPLGPPILCYPGFLYPQRAIVIGFPTPYTTVHLSVPPIGAFVGFSACMQGFAVFTAGSGCFGATDGVVITVLP